jgi:hypothetical protein
MSVSPTDTFLVFPLLWIKSRTGVMIAVLKVHSLTFGLTSLLGSDSVQFIKLSSLELVAYIHVLISTRGLIGRQLPGPDDLQQDEWEYLIHTSTDIEYEAFSE